MIELMKPKLTFTQSEIQDGDIICFQVDVPEKEYVICYIQFEAPTNRLNAKVARLRSTGSLF